MDKKPSLSITMDDVARRAGVGLATVGRVLHNKGYVAPETRRAVEEAVRTLGYVPNLVARSLKRRENRVWGHVTVFNPNQLFAGISSAVDAAAALVGYRVATVATHRDRTPLAAQIRDLVEQQVEGILFTSHSGVTADLVDPLIRAGLPVVMIERTLRMPTVDRIVVRDHRGAFDAVQTLLNRGHRRVGFVGCAPTQDVETRRWEGYRAALIRAGIEPEDRWTSFTPDYGVDEGRKAMARLLDGPRPPTAVFLTSDVLAAGALQEAYARGLKVPGDLSMIGYDNTLAAYLSPALTSMGLPLDEIGRQAVELLVSRAAATERPGRTVGVSPVLVDRGTVAGAFS